jgi:hypothetical protein
MQEDVHAGEPAHHWDGAEGATAPETLRPKGPPAHDRLWREARFASAEGITISGKRTEGASLRAFTRMALGCPLEFHEPMQAVEELDRAHELDHI